MFSFNFRSMESQIQGLMARYRALPRHIARKHLVASANRASKDGIPILRSVTPKGGRRRTRSAVKRDDRGRFQAGSGKIVNQRGGALRRSATAKSKFVSAGPGVVYAVVGYRAGIQSRKAIWLEFGTKQNLTPRRLIDKFMKIYKGPALANLKKEMLVGLGRAARELAGGKNPGRR